MSSINAQLAVWLLLFIVGIVLLYGKKNGFAMDKMGPAIVGGAVTYIAVLGGFWLVAQLGWWSLGRTSEMVSVDDKFADGYSSIVTGSMLNSDGMTSIDLGDESPKLGDHNDRNGEKSQDHSSYAPAGPRSDAAVDPKAAAVEVVWPTPTPEPTPVSYKPTRQRSEMLPAWKTWFEKANYNRGKTNTSKIPAGVSCRVIKSSSKSWFGLRGQNIWTMRCFDPNNEDYGTVDINLTEQAKNQLGVSGDEGLVEGTGTWPNGFFIPEGKEQSQAPASAPGPASATLVGPDVLPNIFTHWLFVDAAGGVDCTTQAKQFKLPSGSRYRFDPAVVKDNGIPNMMAKVRVVVSSDGSTCWAPLWSGWTHVVQP